MSEVRYAKYVLVAVIIASLVSIAPNFAYSQAGRFTVSVDMTSYGTGQTITVMGTVPAVLESVPVAIQVFNPRNTMYTIGQPTPVSDGTFSFEFKVGGKLGINGIYTVKATYSGQSVETTFEFTGGEGRPKEGTKTFQFEGKSYSVDVSLSNGSIKSIEVDPDFTSIIVFISTSSTQDGMFEITLPRDIIDSKINGQDDEYIVLVDGEEADATEKDTTSTSRTLVIPIEAGAEEVEIIGTEVIPEFGVIAALILAAAFGAIIVASRKSQMLKVLSR